MDIGVVGNPAYEKIPELLARLQALASRLRVNVHVESNLEEHWRGSASRLDPNRPQQHLDVLLTLGGDGTLLRGARLLAQQDVPLLGINLGKVGFLTATSPDALEENIERFCAGEFVLELHTTLTSAIIREDGTHQNIGEALNDIVVHKRGTARVVQLSVAMDAENLGQYSADGIIVATPTGSTAYSLSAGGPVVAPNVDALVVTAICPHTLAVRPIVVPATSRIRIRQAARFGDAILVSLDGQTSIPLLPGEAVVTQRGEVPKRLVRFERERFFERVRKKLQWGDLSGRETDSDAH